MLIAAKVTIEDVKDSQEVSRSLMKDMMFALIDFDASK